MRVGIMGGTLDPVHLGHLKVAQAARAELSLDRVMLLPAGDPPHKHHPTLKTDRLKMAQLAVQGLDGLFVSSIEVFREGTTYTVDTLNELRARNPHTQWYYLIGADTLDVLDSWRDFPEVAKNCVFAVNGRADEPASQDKLRQLHQRYGAEFVLLDFCGPDISSTEIRRRVCAGGDISGMTTPAVADYIRRKGLYLSRMHPDEILTELNAMLKPGRVRHTLGVADTARRLAERNGVEPARAYLAGLLHDCAKSLPLPEMQALVAGRIPDVDASELASAAVLHAPAGAVLARERFGVEAEDILRAIRRHTLGDAQMSALDALIYVSDFIEPNRADFPGLGEARALAETDIRAAMKRCAELTTAFVRERGGQPHPRTAEMLGNH